ncbi:lipoprotein N-acyltransferase Lnb domain-containing protein [Corallococcus terminator]|uniref:DUF4105 domain-containing protein n=1 Tax=Corallococcus terminator TaxID=2316733 RepID=A0A3A8J906_9BACT|nr:DUF4105 domain-containing protein [Corallococcus terminator]RKG86961.1 DUF4105 domain-containing protein [Corallococcus terminator]
MPRLSSLALSSLLGLLLLTSPARAASVPPWGTGDSRGEDLSIWLVTFSPGDDVFAWWGHGSLVVEDRARQMQRLYNYGMYSFDDETVVRFAKGRLEFWVGESSVNGTFRLYKSLGRDVRVQELNLTPEQRVKVAKRLADNVLPENREYLYEHYSDNCVTRLRDMIDSAVGGRLSEAERAPARMNLREHTRRYTAVNPPMSLLLDFMMNDSIDKPITRREEAFLPDELEQQVAELKVPGADGQPVSLVEKQWNYFASSRPRPPATPPNFGPWIFALGVLLGASALGLAAWERRGSRAARILLGVENMLVGLVLGIPGLALVVMWIGTDHVVTHHNENLFLANPVTLLAVPYGLRLTWNSVRARARLKWVWGFLAATGALGVVLKVLPWFDQDNWRLVALILPISLGMAGAFWLDRLRARAAVREPASRREDAQVPSLKAS